MKAALVFLALFAFASMAAADSAETRILQARHDFVSCDVQYAHDWIDAREECADDANVSVADFSARLDDIDDDLADLGEAADDGDRLSFGLASIKLGADTLKLIGEVIKDALTGKNLAFFSCIREDEQPLMEGRDDCHADALESEKDAAKDYVQEELDNADSTIAALKAAGLETSGMEDVVSDGEELLDDIDAGYESGDPKEIRALHLRHSRLVLLFRAEQMLATIDYAEPIIEAGHNDNKDEILERGGELRDDVGELLDDCEYSADVEDNYEYGLVNTRCWDDGFGLLREFNSIRLLILEGA